MKTQVTRLHLIVLTLAIFLAVGLTAQERGGMVVASNGTIMKLQVGPYGELFPGGSETEPDNSVLALDVFHADHFSRVLVPQTENTFAEIPAALHYEKNSDLTFLLWEGLVNGLHPFLYLTSYDGSQWSEVLQINGHVFADKGFAQLVVVPESGPSLKSASQNNSLIKRSVIYVSWWEDSAIGSQKYMVPVILQEGSYLGWHESLNVSKLLESDYAPNDKAQPIWGTDSNLDHILRLQPSVNGSSVALGFMDSDTGRLITLGFEMLPQELSDLAAHVAELMLIHGTNSTSVDQLVERVRAGILTYGTEFHQGMLQNLADEIGTILSERPTVATAVTPDMIDKAGIHILHVGARIRAKGLIESEPILDIMRFGQTSAGGGPYHHMKVSLLADRPAPQTTGETILFLSRTGHDSLVAWEQDGEIRYIESEGDFWGDEQAVQLRDDLDRDAVFQILSDRTLNR